MEQISLLPVKSWNLPQDITFDIFSRLSVKIVMRCRCVSKTWRAWLSNRHFISLHLTRASEDNDCSLLFTSVTSPGRGMTVEEGREIPYIDFDFKVHLIESKHSFGVGNYSIPCLDILYVARAASCNGLICSCVDFRTLILSNPFTREELTFSGPIIPYEVNDVQVGFGYHPRTKEYKILCFSFGCPDQNSFINHLEVQTLGSGSWRSKGEVPVDIFNQQLNVLVNGALHWLAYFPIHLKKVVISYFDIADEEFRVLQVPTLVNQWEHRQIQEIEGFLSIASFSSCGLVEIWIMKNYGADDSWSKQFTVSFPEKVKPVHLICKLDRGKILIQYDRSVIVYDPNSDLVMHLPVQAPEGIIQCIAHVGSLLSPIVEMRQSIGRE